MRLPTQANCDPEKPDEHVLWALTQIPMSENQPILMPVNVARVISKHLHECGFRLIPALQTKRLAAPYRGQQHALNGAGKWVDINDPEPDPVMLPDVAAMTVHEQELMISELKRIGRIQDPPPDRDTASVVSLKSIGGQAPADSGGGS